MASVAPAGNEKTGASTSIDKERLKFSQKVLFYVGVRTYFRCNLWCLSLACIFIHNFKDRKATTLLMILSGHTLPADRARELFTPAMDAESLRVSIEKFWIW